MIALQVDNTGDAQAGIGYILLQAHSGIRWIVLVVLLAAIVIGFLNASSGKPYKKGLFASAMGMLHLQVILGIIVLIVRKGEVFSKMSMGDIMKDPAQRYDIIEHPVMMIVAAIIATIGYSVGKRAQTDALKNRRTAILFTIALLLIGYAIPWSRLGQ